MDNNRAVDRLINNLKKFELKYIPEKPKTFLEIMGCENRETISSNILKFFLDSEEKHQLGDLCLRVLLSLYEPEYSNKSFRVKSIKTEVATKKGNRIDLWIKTEEELIIIENKIYHTANNPFDDYEKTARKEIETLSNEKGVNLELISILLGFKNYNKSFKSITHFDFLRKLKAELVNYTDNNYVLFLNQYIETMLKKDTSSELYKMNKESADFVRNHIEEIEKLEEIVRNTCSYYETQLKNVIATLDDEALGIEWTKVEHNDDSAIKYSGAFSYSKPLKWRRDTYQLWLGINVSTICVGICFYKNGSQKDCYQKTIEKFAKCIQDYDKDAKEVYLLDEKNIGFTEEEIAKKFIEVIKEFQEKI